MAGGIRNGSPLLRKRLAPVPESPVGKAIRAAAAVYKSDGQKDRVEGMVQAAHIADKLLSGAGESLLSKMGMAGDLTLLDLARRVEKLEETVADMAVHTHGPVAKEIIPASEVAANGAHSRFIDDRTRGARCKCGGIVGPGGWHHIGCKVGLPLGLPPNPLDGLAAGDRMPGGLLSKCEHALLRAMVLFNRPMPLAAVLLFAGYRPSGGVNRAVASLRRSAFVCGSSAALEATDEGRRVLGPVDPLPTGDALVVYWRGELTAAASAILGAVHDHGGSIEMDHLLKATHYQPSGGVNRAIGTLRRLGILAPRGTPRFTEHFKSALGGAQ